MDSIEIRPAIKAMCSDALTELVGEMIRTGDPSDKSDKEFLAEVFEEIEIRKTRTKKGQTVEIGLQLSEGGVMTDEDEAKLRMENRRRGLGGYQPTSDLDTSKPPQGGSGVARLTTVPELAKERIEKLEAKVQSLRGALGRCRKLTAMALLKNIDDALQATKD